MMVWRRAGGRLCAAAVDLTRRSPGSCLLVRLKADGATGHVTETLRKGHTALWSLRPLCGAAGSAHAHLSTRPPPDPRSRARGLLLGNTDWRHWERVAAVAVGLSASYNNNNSEGGSLGRVEPPWGLTERRRRHDDREQPRARAAVVSSAAPWTVSRRSLSTFTRASSTATAAKRSETRGETGAEEPVQDKKENMKEAPSDPSSSEKAPGEPEPEGEKPSRTQQLKNVFKEYGAVGVCFHISISLMSLGMFYLLISSGIDMAAVLCKLGFSESLVQSKMAAGTSTFVLAYAVHKLFAPARISVTLVSVPLIVRYFRKTGLFKPPTPTP